VRADDPRRLHTGEALVLVPLSADQLAELIDNTLRVATRDLLLRALALIDPERAKDLA
jgi:hypothetical protein